MKTMWRITLVIAFAAIANTLFAAGNLKVNLFPVNGEKAVLAITSFANSDVQITVTDENNRIVYFKETTTPDDNYKKVYDFSQLENGEYKVTVVCDALTTERAFQKTHGAIKVGAEKTTMEPFFGLKDNLFRCTYLNFSKARMTLNFYAENELVMSKELGRGFVCSEALNLAQLAQGKYLAVLYAGDKEYSYNIDK